MPETDARPAPGAEGPAPLLARALEIARAAHAGQVDKAGRPYIEHVLRVVAAVRGERTQTVAALHDVLEDCPQWHALGLIAAGIPQPLVIDVWALTRTDHVSAAVYYERIKTRPRARAVKLADIRDNADPGRLALLPARDRERLSRKYAAALARLGAEP